MKRSIGTHARTLAVQNLRLPLPRSLDGCAAIVLEWRQVVGLQVEEALMKVVV
jgi:hypothetical protein